MSESTIKRNHSAIGERTAWEVWTQEKDNLMKAIRLLGCMSEEKIDVTQYRSILEAIFTENNNILSSLDSPNRSNLHRMIRIYDSGIWTKKDPVIQASASRHHHGDPGQLEYRQHSICKQTPAWMHYKPISII